MLTYRERQSIFGIEIEPYFTNDSSEYVRIKKVSNQPYELNALMQDCIANLDAAFIRLVVSCQNFFDVRSNNVVDDLAECLAQRFTDHRLWIYTEQRLVVHVAKLETFVGIDVANRAGNVVGDESESPLASDNCVASRATLRDVVDGADVSDDIVGDFDRR